MTAFSRHASQENIKDPFLDFLYLEIIKRDIQNPGRLTIEQTVGYEPITTDTNTDRFRFKYGYTNGYQHHKFTI